MQFTHINFLIFILIFSITHNKMFFLTIFYWFPECDCRVWKCDNNLKNINRLRFNLFWIQDMTHHTHNKLLMHIYSIHVIPNLFDHYLSLIINLHGLLKIKNYFVFSYFFYYFFFYFFIFLLLIQFSLRTLILWFMMSLFT